MSKTLTVGELIYLLLKDCHQALNECTPCSTSESTNLNLRAKVSDQPGTEHACSSLNEKRNPSVTELSLHCILPIAGLYSQGSEVPHLSSQEQIASPDANRELLLTTERASASNLPLFEVRIRLRRN